MKFAVQHNARGRPFELRMVPNLCVDFREHLGMKPTFAEASNPDFVTPPGYIEILRNAAVPRDQIWFSMQDGMVAGAIINLKTPEHKARTRQLMVLIARVIFGVIFAGTIVRMFYELILACTLTFGVHPIVFAICRALVGLLAGALFGAVVFWEPSLKGK